MSVRYATLIGLVIGGMGLLLSSPALAFKLNGSSWSYMANPMGEDWTICPAGMPGDAVQRTKDGAAAWDYEHFHFTFAPEACLSNGSYPLLNNVNQFDFGPLGAGVLANTSTFFFTNDPKKTVECDTRFNSAVNWYTGTGMPAANQFDWQSVATHEMGHCLGLDHEDSVTPLPVMRTSLPVGVALRELTPDAIAGRNAIYSQPGGSPGGAPSSASGGRGGGCSLMPGSLTDAPALYTALGNIVLPLLLLLALRIWSRRHAADGASR